MSNIDTFKDKIKNLADATRRFSGSMEELSISEIADLLKKPTLYNLAITTYNGENIIKSISNIDLSIFDTQNITDMSYMFRGCSSLTSITFPENFGSNVTSMYSMFFGCSSLTSITFPENFGSNVTSMSSMFYNCKSLTTLNLSNFDTQSVADMGDIFRDCSSLTSITFPENFGSNVTSMYGMFYGCSSLPSIDLSNFNTQSVTSIGDMFHGCSSLTTLDLTPLNTQSVTYMNYMFSSCSALTTLTLGENWASNSSITSFDLSYCPLTHDSCLDVFNKLATKTSSSTLKLKSTTKALMSDAEIKIATDKGWTVS